MRFIDEVKITVSSGKGGDGHVSFRREKYVPFGGPDGGDGGDGGDIYLEASTDVNTLQNFRGRRFYKGQDGENGMTRQCNGSFGEHAVLTVPVGTIARKVEDGKIIADLTVAGEKVLIARGGRGGLGNMNFKTSTNQAPRFAMEGKPGVEFEIELEIKLLADIALIGLPNVGKSTLISVISSAKPKIADYPFTTLTPNLGVVDYQKNSFVVADIPGLIEDASEGKGLGIKFLKHIERTKAFVHLVDISWCIEEFEALDAYTTIRNELLKYNKSFENKKEVICLTKTDTMTEEEVNKYVVYFEEQLGKKVLPISGVTGSNVETIKALMHKVITTVREEEQNS